MTEELKAIESFVSGCNLVELRMLECECRPVRMKAGKPPSHLQIHTTIKRSFDSTSGRLLVNIAFSLQGEHEASESDSWDASPLAIRATYAVVIEVQEEFRTKDRQPDVLSLGQRSGLIATWPHWRDLVHSLTQRLGLPPLIVPFLNIPAALSGKVGEDSLVREHTGAQKKSSEKKAVKRKPS